MFLFINIAAAWDTIDATWSDSAPTWYLQGSLSGVEDADAEAAVQAALTTWSGVECAGLTLGYGGRVSDAEPGVADGRNVIFLIDSGWPSEASLVSAPFLTTDGATIVDGDVALNGVDYRWSTESADGRTQMDVQGAVTHELGHALGLWHSTASDASLNPLLDGNPDARDLADDDIEGLCTLYSGVSGAGLFGDVCDTTEDCAEDLLCLVDGADRYCTEACADDGVCPEGYACLDAGDEPVCARAVEEEGCGCDSTGGVPMGIGVGLLAVLVWRRRGLA